MIEAKTIFGQVARRYGVEEDEVSWEIEKAISFAMENADPDAARLWANIPRKGERPSPEELITYLVGLLIEET